MRRKIYLSVISFTFVIWSLALIKLEYTLMNLNQTVHDTANAYSTSYFNLSSLIGNMQVPLTLHILIISLIASMIVWLLNNYKELLGLYSKEIATVKEKTNDVKNQLQEKQSELKENRINKPEDGENDK